MENLTKGIKEKAQKMRGEMLELFKDMGNEIKSISRMIKEETEKISNEMKKKIR